MFFQCIYNSKIINETGSPIEKKVTNFGFEPTPVISPRLPAQCNVQVRVNDLERKDHPR